MVFFGVRAINVEIHAILKKPRYSILLEAGETEKSLGNGVNPIALFNGSFI